MIKLLFFYIIFIFYSFSLFSRNIGETEITTEDGIEVFQKEKYYLLKKNVLITSDTFSLSGNNLKVLFDKDLCDISIIYADGNVILNSKTNGIKAIGNYMEIFLKEEKILVKGINSELHLKQTSMFSDGTIELVNQDGNFYLNGPNSVLESDEINISGKNIEGKFTIINQNREIIKLNVDDDNISNVKTKDVEMYSKKVIYNKKNSIIELFENVKIIRGNEIITGDYGTLDTQNNSYKVKSRNEKKVKVIISENE